MNAFVCTCFPNHYGTTCDGESLLVTLSCYSPWAQIYVKSVSVHLAMVEIIHDIEYFALIKYKLWWRQLADYDFLPDFDECSSDPCQHGACTDHMNYFSCSCDTNYSGTLCDSKSKQGVARGNFQEGCAIPYAAKNTHYYRHLTHDNACAVFILGLRSEDCCL